MLQNNAQNPLLPLFSKVLAFPQFSMYADEIDMIYHAWMEYDTLKISRIDGMNG